MGKNKLILIGAIAACLLAVVFAFDDNLSELAPFFAIAAAALFCWLIYSKTMTPETVLPAVSVLTKSAGFTAIGGLLLLGGSCLGDLLSQCPGLPIWGLLLMVVALLLRIAGGMMAKKVDTGTGLLSIMGVLGLTGLLAFMGFIGFIVFSILNGLHLI